MRLYPVITACETPVGGFYVTLHAPAGGTATPTRWFPTHRRAEAFAAAWLQRQH